MDNRKIFDTLRVLGILKGNEYKDLEIIDLDIRKFINLLRDKDEDLKNCVRILYWICSYLKDKEEREISCDDLYNILAIYKKYMEPRLSKLLSDLSSTIIIINGDFENVRLHLRRKRIDLVSNYSHDRIYDKYGVKWNGSLWVLRRTNLVYKEFINIDTKEIINHIGCIELSEKNLTIHYEEYSYNDLVEIVDKKRDRIMML